MGKERFDLKLGSADLAKMTGKIFFVTVQEKEEMPKIGNRNVKFSDISNLGWQVKEQAVAPERRIQKQF